MERVIELGNNSHGSKNKTFRAFRLNIWGIYLCRNSLGDIMQLADRHIATLEWTDMPTQTPIVSVIMPAYNAESTIQESICSVLNQTYHDRELIVHQFGWGEV